MDFAIQVFIQSSFFAQGNLEFLSPFNSVNWIETVQIFSEKSTTGGYKEHPRLSNVSSPPHPTD